MPCSAAVNGLIDIKWCDCSVWMVITAEVPVLRKANWASNESDFIIYWFTRYAHSIDAIQFNKQQKLLTTWCDHNILWHSNVRLMANSEFEMFLQSNQLCVSGNHLHIPNERHNNVWEHRQTISVLVATANTVVHNSDVNDVIFGSWARNKCSIGFTSGQSGAPAVSLAWAKMRVANYFIWIIIS